MLSPFEWWCRNFILPDICKPCLFVFLRNLFYLTSHLAIAPARGQPLFVPFSGEKGNVKALSHRRPVGAGSMKVLLRALAGDWRNCRPLYFPRLPAVSPSNPSKYTVYCTLLINPMESLPHAVQRPYRMSLQMEYFLVHEYHTEYHQFRVE